MKKINFIKTTIALSFCSAISMTGFSQKNTGNFNGWSVSLHAGAATTQSGMHWNAPLQVNQVSNLLRYNIIFVVPAATYQVRDTNTNNTGVAASLQIGYNKTFGHLLVGAEAGIGINPAKLSQTATFYPETALQARNPLTIQRTISVGWSKSLNVKFGYTKGAHLVYGMAGMTFNSVTMISTDDYKLSFQQKTAAGTTAAAPGSYNYTSILHEQKETHTLMGMSWGIGYQYMVSEGVCIGVEYRQTGFNKGSYTTEKVTGEQAINDKGEKVGVAAGIESSNLSVNMKQQILTFKIDVALSAIFK
ncbi:MAG: outer membrane beta-barrel protein [Sediminibacterium sp.]